MTSVTDSAQQTRRFHHEAVFYADEAEFLAATVPFLSEGLEAEEPVLVSVGAAKIELLRAELNEDAAAIEFADMQQLGRNPARIIPAWRDFVERSAGEGKPVRGIGEPVWPGRSAAELDECRRHESLLNLVFADLPAWSLLCPYDAGLDDEVLEAARQTHPHLGEDGAHARSPAYQGPGAAALDGELPEPGSRPRVLGFVGGADLSLLRRFIAECAEGSGLSQPRISDLVLAVNEAATNSMRHGGGHGTLGIWIEDGTLLCEVHDQGRIEDPLLGRIRPKPEQVEGRGLYVANQLCDLVQIRSGLEGTTVRLHMRAG